MYYHHIYQLYPGVPLQIMKNVFPSPQIVSLLLSNTSQFFIGRLVYQREINITTNAHQV